MTKHNAEMENSREQSRVCARLPLNLQLFAEDTGENGADTNAEGAAGDTDANSDGGNTTPTFDELLKDKKFQSEFDSRVSKALATARAKWEESAKEQADEAKKLSSMNKEERERYNLAKDRQAFEQEKAAFAKKQLETAVAAELLQRKLPAQFAAFLTGNDATASQKNLEAFDAAFQEAVQAATTANLRGKDLPPAGKEATGDNVPPTDFRAYEAWRKQNG